MPLAAALACLVIGIADGDTLTARCDASNGKMNVTVRLAEIDAPEKGQAFGNRSKQHLADVCFQKAAVVRPRQCNDAFVRALKPSAVASGYPSRTRPRNARANL